MGLKRWKLVLPALLLPVLLSRPGVWAAAAPSYAEALARLSAFGIAKGLSRRAPEAPVTRAELARLLVEAAGYSRTAHLAAGSRPYPDADGHPEAGYILVARNLGLLDTPEGGYFAPDRPATQGEALAMIGRLVGAPAAALAGFWPEGTAAGPPAAAGWEQPVTWAGLAILADRAFGQWRGADGLTLYQRNFDATPPELALHSLPEQTDADQIAVSGTATGATSVAVNGVEVAARSGSGVLRFQTGVPLQLGFNTIQVSARDPAGNLTTVQHTIERLPPPPARLEGPSELRLHAGETVTLPLTAFDAEGRPVPLPRLTASVSGAIGRYDPATHQFTAGLRPGRGSIRLQAGCTVLTVPVTVGPAPIARVEITVTPPEAAPLTMVRVQAQAIDTLGRVVRDAQPVWEFRSPHAVFDPVEGKVVAGQPGRYPLRATVGGVTAEATVAIWGEVAGLVLEGPAEVLGNEQELADFTVTAVDRHGTRVGDARNRITLEAGGAEAVNRAGRPIQSLTLSGGRATFYVRAGAALWNETVTVSVTGQEDPSLRATAPLTVRSQKPVAVRVSPASAYLISSDPDQTNRVTLAVVDEQQAPLLTGEWEIRWEVSGPARVVEVTDAGEVLSGAAGRGQVTYVGGQEPPALLLAASAPGAVGEVTVSGATPGLLEGTATVAARLAHATERLSLAVSPGQATVTTDPGAGVAVTVAVNDQHGSPITYTGTVFLEVSGGLAAAGGLRAGESVLDTDGDGTPDRVELKFHGEQSRTIRLAATRAGRSTLNAQIPAVRPVQSRTYLTWTANPDASQLGVHFAGPRTSAAVPLADPTAVLEVEVVDAFGNPVARPGVAVTLAGRAGGVESGEVLLNQKAGPVTVTTNSRGRANLRVAIPAVTGQPFQVQILDAVLDGQPLAVHPDRSSFAITASQAVPERLELSLVAPDGTQLVAVQAGEPVVLQAVVQNRSGQPLAGAEGLLRLGLPDSAWSRDPAPENGYGTPEPAADLAADGWVHLGDSDPAYTGVYQRTLYPAGAGELQVTVGVDTWQRRVEAGATLLVTPGPTAGLVLVGAGEVLALPEGEWVAVTLAVSDRWGNSTAGDGEYEIEVATTGGVRVRLASGGRELTEGWTAYLTEELALQLLLPGGGQPGTLTFSEAGGRLLPRTYVVEGAGPGE